METTRFLLENEYAAYADTNQGNYILTRPDSSQQEPMLKLIKKFAETSYTRYYSVGIQEIIGAMLEVNAYDQLTPSIAKPPYQKWKRTI